MPAVLAGMLLLGQAAQDFLPSRLSTIFFGNILHLPYISSISAEINIFNRYRYQFVDHQVTGTVPASFPISLSVVGIGCW
jgi:hypothetical protein